MTNRTMRSVLFLFGLNGLLNIVESTTTVLEKIIISLKRKEYISEYDERPDDIYIASFMESGATWLQVILYQLTSSGDMNFKHIYDISPTLESELMKIFSTDLKQLPSPRFIKTHLPYNLFIRKPLGKVIYIIRDGREVAVSLYRHLLHLNTILDFDRAFNEYFLKLHNIGWFGHLTDWLTNNKNLNILYIKFEDLQKDIEGSIRKIIDFCGFVIDDSKLQGILKRCRFDFLEKHREKLIASTHPDVSLNIEYNIEFNDFLEENHSPDTNSYFSPELNKTYIERFETFLSGFNLDYELPTPESAEITRG